jgi:cysteine desulfurase/selenocysteine lyase
MRNLPRAARTDGADAPSRRPFDVAAVRRDFPILQQRVYGKPLVYLDNAATSQKPRAVIDAVSNFYRTDNANIHRGVHSLSERATAAYEAARVTVQQFLNAREAREIVFVRGTTEAINLVARAYARPHLRPGDEIVVSILEHHSNFVPWKMACEATGARLRVVPMTDAGELRLDEYERLLSGRTRIVAIGHVSNALGTVNPVSDIVRIAHAHGIPVLVDGAQAVPFMTVDVKALDCDFYAFSGHKVFGPTGIGVLYGKADLMNRMPPWQGGGDMISSVTLDEVRYNVLPAKFEAGTPDIAGAIGLAAAIDYLERLDRVAATAHETALTRYLEKRLSEFDDVTVVGQAKEKAGIVSFIMSSAHPHDIGTVVDREGVAIRTGHHCCQPLMDRLGIAATARASFAFYNTYEDADRLVDALARVREMFG